MEYDPDKQFHKYLKNVYADYAFKRYEGILKNTTKFDVQKLKQKYTNGSSDGNSSHNYQLQSVGTD